MRQDHGTSERLNILFLYDQSTVYINAVRDHLEHRSQLAAMA